MTDYTKAIVKTEDYCGGKVYYPALNIDTGWDHICYDTYEDKNDPELLATIDFVNSILNNPGMPRDDGIFYIENSIDERRSSIMGYFKTFREARAELKNCNDWYCDKDTGKIYFIKFGRYGDKYMVFNKSR